jgi:hypothetical protein
VSPAVPQPGTAPKLERPEPARRGQGDHGSGLVAGIVFIFAFTFLGLVWLARDVDRGVSNQSAATSIAFQAARAGAQAARVDDLRAGDVDSIDQAAARAAARSIAGQLFDSYGVAGSITSIEVRAAEQTVIVTVSITDGPITVFGRGAAEAVPN